MAPEESGEKVDASRRLIESLRNPQAYPHEAQAIELIETHISWVLLTGRFAYKIKKPVDLGFVDFSTLERREHFCREELRLNRRLAPHLYLDVVPIAGETGAPRVAGDGPALEFAVRMRQFPGGSLLSRVLERQELERRHIDALAEEVAGFHRTIDVAPAESPFGTAERVHEPVVENFRHLEIESDRRQRDEQLRRLRAWSDAEHAAKREVISCRKTSGFVRECHGDMHLGNMILDGDRVVIFDCIEFNESLRWIDVMSEVAFCTMDLEDRGRPDLSHRFLNAYLERTGDYEGLAVLPYYLVYRAMVRAKVTGIRLQQAGLDSRERRRLIDECHGYLDLAERYAREMRPWLAVTHGFSGSGKTTGTTCLVEACGAIRVRSDVERKRLFGFEANERTGSRVGEDLYTADASQRTYARLARSAEAALRAGFPVIVDATFLRHDRRTEFRELAERLKTPFRILDFRTPEHVLRERISARRQSGRDASEADLAVLAGQIAAHERLTAEETAAAVAVDTQSPRAADDLVEALRRLESPGERPA